MGRVIRASVPSPESLYIDPKGLGIFVPKDTIIMGAYLSSKHNNVFHVLLSDGRTIEVPMRHLVDNMIWSSLDNITWDATNHIILSPHGEKDKCENKIEKLFTQPKNLIEAVDFRDLGIINEDENTLPKFIEGENYALKGISCDGFDMEEKVYKLIKVVDDFYGTPINSLIVKQISGEQGVIYTLSKNDCTHHGIEYESGLQLFPKTLSWTRVKEDIPFDRYNLATTPLSNVDNTIRHIVLRLDGFKDYYDGYILTPSGHLIKEDKFKDSLRIIAKEPIVYGNGYVFKDKTNLNIELAYPKNLLFNHANFISSEDTVFVLINLEQEFYAKCVREAYNTIDNRFGVEPKYLDGINPNEFFEISWDELGALTIEEYEGAKERARQEAEKAAKQLEEERKRKAAEDERRSKELLLQTQKAVERMRGYEINKPSFPSIPTIRFNGSIESCDMIGETLDRYFSSLDDELNKLSKNLDMLGEASGNWTRFKIRRY